MRNRYRIGTVMVAVCLLLAGCAGEKKEGDVEMYYLNTEGNTLASEAYDWKSEQAQEQVEEALEKLRKPEDTVACTSAVPSDVSITDWTIEEGRLDLSFSQEYELLDRPSEVLLRAAVVKSLAQIEGVEAVRFHVGGEPLKNGHGEEIGYMQGDEFIQIMEVAPDSEEKQEESTETMEE